ncbi:hypothetical protein HanIR_Chr11g0550431 [Helianthus annuus]|nr:hypothetical protein HanIR_Chr11g0550431 [Helianthus annuus]
MADDKTNGSVQNIENTPDIYHQVAEEEQQRMILGEKKTTPTETVAFKACIPCQRDNNANQRQRRGDAIEQCTHCGRNGHDWDRCFKKIGCPNRRSINAKRDEGKPKATHVGTYTSPVPGLTKEQFQLFLKFFAKNNTFRMANMAIKGGWDDEWVVD